MNLPSLRPPGATPTRYWTAMPDGRVRCDLCPRECRLHDVNNVFVIDSSAHVTNGGFNPALTIMAIAYFASQSLVANWKAGGLRS